MLKTTAAALFSGAVLVGNALAVTVSFDELEAGSKVAAIAVPGAPGKTLATVESKDNNLFVFDTNDEDNPNDGDLKTPISGGLGDFNNVLIFGTGGDEPNDTPDGGEATFHFEQSVTAVSIDVIDITGDVFITLLDADGKVLFDEKFYVELDTKDNAKTNLADTLFFGDDGIHNVATMVISYTESGAFDNLVLDNVEIPVPGALPLFLAGFGGLTALRRRRRSQ